MHLVLEHAARTDVGTVRRNNEDAIFASPRLVAVADGVGGSVGGEIASRLVVDALGRLDKCWLDGPLEDALAGAAAVGNDMIAFIAECRPSLAGMATTLTAAAVDRDVLTLTHIGDSRAYLMRGGQMRQLTRDDSLVQELLDTGALTARQARKHPERSVVLEVLDGRPGRQAVISAVRVRDGDRLLLCSDGLSDYVDELTISVALSGYSLELCANRLIALALAAGSRDNVTAVVADVVLGEDATIGWRRPTPLRRRRCAPRS